MEYNQLEDTLVEDWTWRKIEISDLILLAEKDENKVLLKSIILLLYAHWEGYIKRTSKVYLKFIADNKYNIAELTENFKALSLKGLAKEVLKSSSTLTLSNELKLTAKYSQIGCYTFDKLVKIDLENEKDKSIIDTQDNLNPAVFRNILELIGLTYKKEYEVRENFIEIQLLANRNSIGHGNRKMLEDEDFNFEILSIKKLRDIVVSFIENFRDEILQYSKSRYFLHSNIAECNHFCDIMEGKLASVFKEIETKYNT